MMQEPLLTQRTGELVRFYTSRQFKALKDAQVLYTDEPFLYCMYTDEPLLYCMHTDEPLLYCMYTD
jgi:hypothetical protein